MKKVERRVKGLERLLFYFLIFSLPFQTRKIIYIFGAEFIEWNSVFLYFTDILIVGILAFWLARKVVASKLALTKRQSEFCRYHHRIVASEFTLTARQSKLCRYSGLFLLIAALSLIEAPNVFLAFYNLLKLGEILLLFFYVRYNFLSFNFKKILWTFVASGIFQSLLAILQFFKQESLGLRLLRESPLAPDLAGVAKIVVDGVKMIRAYGTFPHPNVLAAFLLITIFAGYNLFFDSKSRYKFFFLAVGSFLMILGIFLTFSRTVIFVFILGSIIFFILNRKAAGIKRSLPFAICFLLFTICLWPEISSRFSFSEENLSLRGFYNEIAFKAISQSPFLGIGLGNFVDWSLVVSHRSLPIWAYQPVHNIYLLITSEMGIGGITIFLSFISYVLAGAGSVRACSDKNCSDKKAKQALPLLNMLIVFCCFLFIALFDHFFWTLQQGRLMFWLVLGVLVGKDIDRGISL